MHNDIVILDWKPLSKGQLRGFAKVQLPSGMVLIDCPIGVSDRGAWASPPARPQIDRAGNPIKDPTGKIKYSPIIEFTSREVRDRWSGAVIEALRTSHPQAFVPGGAA
jgi:hypothetical protein